MVPYSHPFFPLSGFTVYLILSVYDAAYSRSNKNMHSYHIHFAGYPCARSPPPPRFIMMRRSNRNKSHPRHHTSSDDTVWKKQSWNHGKSLKWFHSLRTLAMSCATSPFEECELGVTRNMILLRSLLPLLPSVLWGQIGRNWKSHWLLNMFSNAKCLSYSETFFFLH